MPETQKQKTAATHPKQRLEQARAALALAQEKTGIRQDGDFDSRSQLVGAWSVTPYGLAPALRTLLTRGGYAALVGLPDIGWLHLAQSGVDLGRLIAIPRPGKALPQVLSACVDSVECTLCGPLSLPASQRAALAARVAASRRFFLWVEDSARSARPLPGWVYTQFAQEAQDGRGLREVRDIREAQEGRPVWRAG